MFPPGRLEKISCMGYNQEKQERSERDEFENPEAVGGSTADCSAAVHGGGLQRD